VAVRVLSIHASYRCGRSGDCCTANWPIPVEADRLNAIRAALARRSLRTVDGGAALESAHAETDTPLLATRAHACVFFDSSGHRTCRIQDTLGHAALPLACRQFPRVSVIDPRGASVTLSHYCPTARAMLGRETPLAIVSAPAFPNDDEYIGLDATSSLPPLLRPDVLMDWDSWWEWERLAIERIGDRSRPIEDALASLALAVEYARAWRPGDGDLAQRVRDAFLVASGPAVPEPIAHDALARGVLNAVPEDIRPAQIETGERPTETVTRAFLAAHAFANWTAHLGGGLRTWLRSLHAAHALLRSGCGVREADLLLRHLAEPGELAKAWSAAEVVGAPRG